MITQKSLHAGTGSEPLWECVTRARMKMPPILILIVQKGAFAKIKPVFKYFNS